MTAGQGSPERAEEVVTETLEVDETRAGAKPAMGEAVVIDHHAWAERDPRAERRPREGIDDAAEITAGIRVGHLGVTRRSTVVSFRRVGSAAIGAVGQPEFEARGEGQKKQEA